MTRARHRTTLHMGACALMLGILLSSGCGGGVAEKAKVVSMPPADPRAAKLYLEGVKQLASGSRAAEDQALASFEAALVIDPQLWEAQYNLGVLYRRRGETRKALPHFQAAHDIQKTAGEPLMALAEARHLLGDRDEASDLLDQYLKAHPDATDVRVALMTVLRERGSYDEALAQAREALVRDPENARALSEVGRIYRAKGDLEVAGLVFHKVLALDPKNAAAHNDLGLLALAQGDTQLAFDHFEKAVQIDPAFTAAHMNRAAVLLRAGDYAAAQAEYDKVLTSSEQDVDARVGLGVALRGQGKHADAERAYERALADSPNHPAALFDLGVLRAEFLNRRSEARELFERYLDVAPSDAVQRPAAERYLAQIPEAAAVPTPAPVPAAAAPAAQKKAAP